MTEVLQADRQRAQALMEEMGRLFPRELILSVYSGECDDHPFVRAFAAHRTAGQAELSSEVSRLHMLAKANNDLARRYAEQIQSLRGAAVLALELIEEIQDEEGFSPSVAIPAQALRAALAPLSPSKDGADV